MASQSSTKIDTVVLDVDGTLVDTVYPHTIAWSQAFATVGVDVPMWRLHRAIGMGGDRLVAEVAGDDVEKKHGDKVREEHDERFGAVIDDIRPLPGAADLLDALRERGLNVVLASSGIEAQTKQLLALVGGDERSHDWTTSDDVEDSKPEPDLIEVAMEKVGGSHAVVVGDAVWDITAAKKAGCRASVCCAAASVRVSSATREPTRSTGTRRTCSTTSTRAFWASRECSVVGWSSVSRPPVVPIRWLRCPRR